MRSLTNCVAFRLHKMIGPNIISIPWVDAERRRRLLGSVSGALFLFSSFVILAAARNYRSTLR